VDINFMHGSAQPDDRFPSASTESATAGTERSSSVGSAGAVGDKSNGSRVLDETELDSALQLLVERAQYITGATGTALALPRGEEMVCRASAGSSAPAVGARLQVLSGLTGESITRRQLLRCDNAETDPRVNLEACRALGIASIVVLPLLRRNGEVRGLFELFSDHPYAFEERDLVALERMADLTLTALDLAEQRQNFKAAPSPGREPEKPVEPATASGARPVSAISLQPEFTEAPVLPAGSPVISPSLSSTGPGLEPAAVPEAMLRVQKCTSCGFPVSEGRTLCLDCEKKDSDRKNFEKKQNELEQGQIEQQNIRQGVEEQNALAVPSAPTEEFVPAFLVNAKPLSGSWMANHVNLLAIVVLILGIMVAVVVFR
jgi:putative methionine-R-sulfoxide reductase with GAF domain